MMTTDFNVVRAIVFGLSLIVILALIFRSLYHLYDLLRKGKPDPERTSDYGKRFMVMLKGVFGQSKLLKHPAGIGHFVIFYGFIFVTAVAMEVFARAIIPGFSLAFLGVAYDFMLMIEDILSVGVIIAIIVALIRRQLPSIRLEGGGKGLKLDMYIILFVVGIHIILSNLLESVELAEGIHPWQIEHPNATMGPFIAKAISGIWPKASLPLVFEILWWLHAASVWLFLLYIVGTQTAVPRWFPSKHFHIISAPFNVFFSNLKPSGRLKPIDFEDESIEQYGVASVDDLTWKQYLDGYSCTGCGRCQEVCPAYLNGQPLSPKALILDIREHVLETLTMRIKDPEAQPEKSLIGDVISRDTLWACTTCNACTTACPVFIDHIDKIVDMRRNEVMMESEFPAGLNKMFNNLEVNFNPWGIGKSDRDLWAENLGVKHMKDNPDTDTLFWVGCAGSFDERAKKVSTALVKILQSAGIDFAILGKEEKCNGDPARRLGNEYLAQELITTNVQLLNEYKVKEIITFCPHCYNTLANEFPDFGGHYKVIHASEYVAQLLRDGKLKVDKNKPLNLTYHDSCYLGRHNGLYTPPREILSMVGIEVKEMAMNHEASMCCGAGGGRVWYELEVEGGTEINNTRAQMAADTGAEYLGVSCPFCTIMLEDGMKNTNNKLEVLDLIEIVAERLK